jgi:hypothetical protein
MTETKAPTAIKTQSSDPIMGPLFAATKRSGAVRLLDGWLPVVWQRPRAG